MLGGAFVRDIGAKDWLTDYRISGRILQRSVGVDLNPQTFSCDQRCDGDLLSARVRDFAAGDRQLQCGLVELLRPQIEQGLAGSGRRTTDIGRAAGNAGTSTGPAVIRRKRGVAFDYGESLDRNTEFFGRGLAKRGGESGADIDFAGVDGDRSIGVDGEKTIDLGGIERLRSFASWIVPGRSARPAHQRPFSGFRGGKEKSSFPWL